MPKRRSRIGTLSTAVKSAGGFRSYAKQQHIPVPSDWKRYASVRREGFKEFCLQQRERVFKHLFFPDVNEPMNVVDARRKHVIRKIKSRRLDVPLEEFDVEVRK